MDSTSSAAPPAVEAAPARLKIAGTWTGILEVELSSWTLPMLQAEVARRSGGTHPPSCIRFISKGKVLRDDGGRSLHELGLTNNTKILSSAAAPDAGKAINDEADREKRLTRLRAAAHAFASRHANGSLPVEDFNVEFENQSGETVEVGSETDKRSLMMGLLLHTNAKSLIKTEQYQDALAVLSMAEEAFLLCNPSVIEMIDNVPILELDTVWCYFMLRDISRLSVAGARLSKARKGFERSHGKDSTRFRVLQEGRQAELAIYLRLELLEGVVAYYSGNFEESHKALSSAQAKYTKLQVSDETLSLLMSMGYKERAAKRALRMSGQDIQCAVDFLVEERAKKTRRYEENIHRQNEILEQKRYGKTPQKKAVDLQRLNELVSIGFERFLAAEALRRNENDIQKALDDLTNPETNTKMQAWVDLEELVSLGYDRSAVVKAVRECHSKEAALKALNELPPVSVENQQPDNVSSMHGQASNLPTEEQVGSSGAIDNGYSEKRDEEMEEELVKEVDPLEDYDLEVTKEGEAIAEYLTLLESNDN